MYMYIDLVISIKFEPFNFTIPKSSQSQSCLILGKYQRFSWFYSLLLAWAAMYLKHHYLTDVLGGWAYAYLAKQIADWGVRGTGGRAESEYDKGVYQPLPNIVTDV